MLTEVPMVSLMEVASIRVSQSVDFKHLLIEYPKVRAICKKVSGFPVVHNNIVLKLLDNIVAECSEGILAVTDGSPTNFATICRMTQHETCACGLHAGGAVDCQTQPSHLEMIHVVDEGMIIINEQRASVSTDGGPEVKIMGTHLLTFEHQAMVNGTRYVNHNEELRRMPGIAASPLLNIIGHDPVLSLPQLKRMNENNLKLIHNFMNDVAAGGSPRIWFIIGVCFSAIFSG